MMNTKTSAADRSSRSSSLATTAALLCMLAGAPAGVAQTSSEESDPSAGLGSLMSFLGGERGGQDAQQQPSFEDDLRTDGLYYDDNMTVELHVQDEELTSVLQMLSIQSERNIVASNDVSARVTANLYGVTFHEALDAILHVNGYGYIEKGNFIYVYPAETLIGIEEAARQVEGRVFNLSFLSAVDASDFVTPLLSDVGEIKANGKVGAWTDPTQPTGNEEYASESMLIVYDYPENIDAIGRMLQTIDVRPAQILVEATIVQTSLNEANAFGVDFSLIADFDYADFANPLGGVDALIRGTDGSDRIPADGGATAIVGTPGNIAGPGTLKAGIVSNDVAVFLRMLNEITSTQVISNPKVVTLNRQPGRVLVGRKVGYLQTTSTDTSTTQSVEFLDTGTQLNFRPFVMGDGIIRMELKPQVSEAQLRSATDATGAAVTIPDEITNELSANVMVPDGHTIVLGGLFREASTTGRRQVPVLGDIPILGAAFRGHDDDIERQEIIFLIKPSILSDQQLVAQGLRAEDSVRQVRAGSREGTLPFGRLRQASQLLVQAEELASQGETSAALHKVRRALRHDPSNSQAIALREELVGELDNWPSQSILDDIIHGAAEVRKDHNILQHGWWGPLVEAEAAETPARAVASDRPAAPGKKSAARGNNFQNRQAGATSGRRTGGAPVGSGNSYTGEDWWNSPEFGQFMTGWATAAAMEQNVSSPGAEWWNSPEFALFLEGWGQAAAQDRVAAGNAPTGNEEWWNTADFALFLSGWCEAAARDGAAMANAESWWASPEFQQFLTGWGQAAAAEGAGGGSDAWWQSPEFRQFMTAWIQAEADEQQEYAAAAEWWNSAAFKEFMAAFETAVEKSHELDQGERTTGRRSPSNKNYTNVPSDNDD